MRDALRFFRTFLRHPADISSVVPTSRFGARKVTGKMRLGDRRRVIVEYGPGTGVIAKHLLRERLLGEEDAVILIEKTPALAEALREEIDDPRVCVVQGSAEDAARILRDCGEERADYVLSSIPLSVMPEDMRSRILDETRQILAPDGKFIVFLFRWKVRRYLEQWFPHIRTDLVLLNIPPLRVFEAEVPATDPTSKNFPVNIGKVGSLEP